MVVWVEVTDVGFVPWRLGGLVWSQGVTRANWTILGFLGTQDETGLSGVLYGISRFIRPLSWQGVV